MPEIIIITEINASIEICFDAARSIDLHSQSTSGTKERAIAGRTSGLCEKGDTVTWEAVHFGVKQKLQSEISEMNLPLFFEDRMLKGAFKSFRHQHHFKFENGKTVMTDNFNYKSPLGIFGKLADKLFLENYMRKFLTERNDFLKRVCEREELTTVDTIEKQ
jgi:ligand-binding SRPBCC domain-containing protein